MKGCGGARVEETLMAGGKKKKKKPSKALVGGDETGWEMFRKLMIKNKTRGFKL